jgi:hypothetical protein
MVSEHRCNHRDHTTRALRPTVMGPVFPSITPNGTVSEVPDTNPSSSISDVLSMHQISSCRRRLSIIKTSNRLEHFSQPLTHPHSNLRRSNNRPSTSPWPDHRPYLKHQPLQNRQLLRYRHRVPHRPRLADLGRHPGTGALESHRYDRFPQHGILQRPPSSRICREDTGPCAWWTSRRVQTSA